MADAVKRLWPATQIDVGRSDHSEKFQYDFDIPVRITPDDLPRIEAEMAKIVAEDAPFERVVVSRDEAQSPVHVAGRAAQGRRVSTTSPKDRTSRSTATGASRICAGVRTCSARDRSAPGS